VKKRIEFSDRQTRELAVFLAELERMHVDYIVDSIVGGWSVEIADNK
jgi:hypothetical protein